MPTKCYQESKEKLQKEHVKGIEIFLKKKKTKSEKEHQSKFF